jgi:hypothetical protein
MVLDRLDGAAATNPSTTIRVGADLIVRKSTGPARA